MLKGLGLKVKLSLLIAMAMFLSALALLLWLNSGLKSVFLRTLLANQEVVVKKSAQELESRILFANTLLDSSVREIQTTGDPATLKQEAVTWFDVGVCVLDPSGNVYAEYGSKGVCGYREFQASLSASQQFFGPWYYTADKGFESWTTFAKPIKAKNWSGWLVAGASFAKSPLFKDALSPGHRPFIVSKDRTVVYHENKLLIRSNIAQGVSATLDQALNSGSVATGESPNLEGTPGLVSVAPVRSLDWYLGTFSDTQSYLAPLDDLVQKSIYAMIGILIVASLSIVGFIAWLTAPLSKLTRHARDRSNPFASLSNLVESDGGELLELAEALDWRTELLISSKAEVESMVLQYELLAEHSSDLICRMSEDFNLTYTSPVAHALLGIASTEHLKGRSLMEFVHFEDRKSLEDSLRKLKPSSAPLTVQHRIRRQDNGVTWLETTAKKILTDNHVELVAVSRDITQRKTREDYLTHIAHHDNLTGLANRALLNFTVNEIVSNGERCALLMLDLDKFKNVNDTLGHDVGDELLIEMGRRLKASVRNSDLVARMGGDEFVVLVRDSKAPEEAAISVAEKILETIRPKMKSKMNHELQLRTSIGIGLFPDHGKNAADLLKAADEAMYRSKQNGGSNYQLYTLTSSSHKGLSVNQQELFGALEAGELTLYYQPVINPLTNKIVAVEGLLRWKHAQKGLVLAESLLSMADNDELLYKIGEFTLSEGVAFMESLHPSVDCSLVLNASGRQLGNPEFMNLLKSIPRTHPVLEHRLEIDVPEAVLSSAPEKFSTLIADLAHLGISVSIDNFGRGYTYLTHLSQFGVGGLKLDTALIASLDSSEKDALLTKGLVDLANSLNLTVTAKGVETRTQYEILKKMGISRIQGFYKAKPMVAGQMKEFLLNPTLGSN